MATIKQFTVIGLGSFGAALARRLCKNGCRVTGLDQSEANVALLKDELYEAMIGDATQRETIELLPLSQSNAVFVSLGEDITRSLLATLHAKDAGARNIIVKGVTQEHGRLLKSLGVSRVIFPEIEIAESLADRMTWTNLVDFLPIDPDYSFVEYAVPDSFSGKTLQGLDVRKKFGIWVVGVKDALTGELTMFPAGDFVVGPDQVLLVVGHQDDLRKLPDKA